MTANSKPHRTASSAQEGSAVSEKIKDRSMSRTGTACTEPLGRKLILTLKPAVPGFPAMRFGAAMARVLFETPARPAPAVAAPGLVAAENRPDFPREPRNAIANWHLVVPIHVGSVPQWGEQTRECRTSSAGAHCGHEGRRHRRRRGWSGLRARHDPARRRPRDRSGR